MARTYKTRHQLFLPEDMSKRLAHIAEASGKARSEILVEALDAWFTRRQGHGRMAVAVAGAADSRGRRGTTALHQEAAAAAANSAGPDQPVARQPPCSHCKFWATRTI